MSNRKRIVAGNWKMNKSFEEGIVLAKESSFKIRFRLLRDGNPGNSLYSFANR